MRKILLIFLSLIVISSHCYSDELEVVAGLDAAADLPVINENFRKKDAEIKAIDTRVTTAEASIAALTASTQAQMETATSTTTYVSPGRTQYHPGVAKAWVLFNGEGTPAIRGTAYGVASIGDNGTGLYTITWSTAFSSADYVVFVTIGGDAASTNNAGGAGPRDTATPLSTTAALIETRNHVGSLDDFPFVSVVAFGDQ